MVARSRRNSRHKKEGTFQRKEMYISESTRYYISSCGDVSIQQHEI